MYEPTGGDKPAYDPPAEPQPYAKPPTEPPSYQKPPTGEPPPYQKPPTGEPPPYPPGEGTPYPKPPDDQPPEYKPPTGNCKCEEWQIKPCPSETEPFRRLLLKLEEILDELDDKPTDATKKFPDDLKDADKEYQGVVAAVTKYKEFYDKLDCKLAEAKSWKEDIDSWLSGKLTDAEKAAIQNSRKTNYDDQEKLICCGWIQGRDEFIAKLDCMEQAKKKEEEAKDNYDAIKGLEKTLTDRFSELKSLYDKAKSLRDEERFKALFAVSLEYAEVYANLSIIRDWYYARSQCGITVTDTSSCPTSPSPPTSGDLKADWTPEKFKAELIRRLRLLILAKFQRFRWQHAFQTYTQDNADKKEACEKFRKDRREQFIQEADDIQPAESTPGEGGGKPGYGEQPPPPPPPDQYGQKPEYPPPPPPPDQYQGGQKPQYPPPPPPPPTGGYPSGQKPEYPPPPPPTGQYEGGQKPEYPAETPPSDKYRGRSKS